MAKVDHLGAGGSQETTARLIDFVAQLKNCIF